MDRFAIVVVALALAIAVVGSVLVALLQMLPSDETFELPPTKPARERDITIGKDQVVGERLARLRKLQEDGIREESRRALERMKKGW